MEPGRFQFHDLLRSFAAERLAAESSAEDREAARVRLLDFYLRTVERCAEVLYPDMQRLPPARRAAPVRLPTISGHQQALHWLDTERANLTAAIQHTAHSGPAAAAWQLADAMRGYLWLGKHVTEWLTTARLGLHAAHAKGHQLAEAAMHQNLGTLHWTLGDYQTSLEHYNHSLRCLLYTTTSASSTWNWATWPRPRSTSPGAWTPSGPAGPPTAARPPCCSTWVCWPRTPVS